MEKLTPRVVPILAMIRRDWKNPPNLVTAARMIGALGLPPLITSRSTSKKVAGLTLFSALVITDKLDGWMAKEIYGSTDLGKMLDPIVDKELILLTMLPALKETRRRGDHQLANVMLATLAVIGVREVSVTLIKLRAQRRTGQVDSAIQSSRMSMMAECAALGSLLVPIHTPLVRKGKFALLAVSAGVSLYSGWDYHRKYRDSSS